MAKILILGGGFGGIVAAEQLSKSLGAEHQITLISQNKKFTFYPALVRLAFGDCEPDDITFDLKEKLDEINVRFVQSKVAKIIANRKRVRVEGVDFKGEISYDYLIIAIGHRIAKDEIAGLSKHSHSLLNIDAAIDFGEEIRTFQNGDIVVGMAPNASLPVPVCETAFALANKFRREIENDQISISIVFPETIDKAFGGANLHHELLEAFRRHGIIVKTDFAVKEVFNKSLKADNGRTINYDLLMFFPPFRGHSFLKELGVSDEFDFLIADELMRVPHFSGVYAVGDILDFSGPKLAHSAVNQAHVAAANVVSEIGGKEPNEFYYHEISTVIDEGGADSIYLHYGIWDESLYRLKKGKFWSLAKRIHDRVWQAAHEP